MAAAIRWRWLAVAVFVISSTINYLDRQLLNVLAPLILASLHLNLTSFGWLISAFSISYAASSLLMGWFLDRAGLNRGISVAVAWWSAAALSSGLAGSYGALSACRAALGIGESAGVPAAGKLNGMYLKPEERALGAAVNQIGLSLGWPLALLWAGYATHHSWRTPFVVTGLFGFLWIPVWLAVNRAVPPAQRAHAPRSLTQTSGSFSLLQNRSLIVLVVANVLWMGGYSLWTNWTTIYFVHVHHLTTEQSARYTWIPSVVSNLGGFFGGWLSLRQMKRGVPAVSARRHAVWVSALCSLSALVLPFATDATWATVVISSSFFFALAGSVNIYALPIDLFGAARSGLAIAALTCAYGILQTVISPVIGFLGDHHLYTAVVWLITLPPLVSALTLQLLDEQN